MNQRLSHRIAVGVIASFLTIGVASCGDDDGDADPVENEIQGEIDEEVNEED